MSLFLPFLKASSSSAPRHPRCCTSSLKLEGDYFCVARWLQQRMAPRRSGIGSHSRAAALPLLLRPGSLAGLLGASPGASTAVQAVASAPVLSSMHSTGRFRSMSGARTASLSRRFLERSSSTQLNSSAPRFCLAFCKCTGTLGQERAREAQSWARREVLASCFPEDLKRRSAEAFASRAPAQASQVEP